MPDRPELRPETEQVADRLDRYRKEIQQLVLRGVEHPRYELTRECRLAGSDLRVKIDFVKQIQGLANAHIREERLLVIGAGQSERRFYPVPNARDFDPASISRILEKYLTPVPRLEVFNSVQTDDAIPFVAIVLNPLQPRPVVARLDITDTSGKVFLRKGDIWIKKDTRLDLATREDLEEMYENRIEAEAESRAHARFAQARDELTAILELHQPSARRVPGEDLLYGRDEPYRLYVQELIVEGDTPRFHMLLELLRDQLVEKWHSVVARKQGVNSVEFQEEISQLRRDSFLPALRRLTETGLLLMKHECEADWFARLSGTLIEAFEVSGRLEAVRELIRSLEGPRPDGISNALEILLAGRTLATYAMRRERHSFLPALLKQYVRPASRNSSNWVEPFLFWPLRLSVPGNDRIAYCWEHTIAPYFPGYFGHENLFVESACELEFTLHFNSFLGTDNPSQKARAWLERQRPQLRLSYVSDIWRYGIESAVPLAEKLLAALRRGYSDILLSNLTVEKTLLDQSLEALPHEKQLEFFAGYLVHLENWHAEAALSANKFLHEVDWGRELGPILQAIRAPKGI